MYLLPLTKSVSGLTLLQNQLYSHLFSFRKYTY